MAITIRKSVTVYEPYDDRDDEPGVAEQWTERHVITDEDMAEAIEFGDTLPAYVASILTDGRGSDCWAVYASVWPLVHVNRHTWYAAEVYEDPATGHRTEVTYHLDGPEWTDEFAREVAGVANWSA